MSNQKSSQDLLQAIVAATRQAVNVAETVRPIRVVEGLADKVEPRGKMFLESLVSDMNINVIAECKQRSPSKGVLRKNYDPSALAKSYELAGASAISVLTEPAFFSGSVDHLKAVRDSVEIPLLRKDFIVTEYQVLEARASGADAILLIVAALDDLELKSLLSMANALGLAVLVEIHCEEELRRALEFDVQIIGVNNRNLRTLDVSFDASNYLVSKIPDSVVAVAESGIRSETDLIALRQVGYDAFLIGEALMTRHDPGLALRGMLEDSEKVLRLCRKVKRNGKG